MAEQPLPEPPPDEAGTGLQAAGLQGGLQAAGLQGLMPPLIPLGAQHPSMGAQLPSKLQARTPTLTRTIR